MMRRVALLIALMALGALVGPRLPSSASGAYSVPAVAYTTASVPATFYSPETHVACLTRADQTSPPDVTTTLLCYSSDKPSPLPPPPPPPLQLRSALELVGQLDEVSGLFAMPLLNCTDFFGVIAVSVTMNVQLDKAGGPASGTVSVIEDTTSPFDCVDGTETTGPLTLTPLAQSHDEDIWGPGPNDTGPDGCSDWEELGESEATGGLRDPFNFWDFFDTPDASNVRDGAIAIGDINRVVARFGSSGDPSIDPLSAPPPAPAYHPAFDRGPSLGPGNWNLDAADGATSVGDINAAVAQFGHSCAAAP